MFRLFLIEPCGFEKIQNSQGLVYTLNKGQYTHLSVLFLSEGDTLLSVGNRFYCDEESPREVQ